MAEEKKIGAWKELMVNQLTEKLKQDKNLLVSDYIGLSAEEMTELRRELESVSSRYMVLKNSIARIALDNAGFGELKKFVEGGTGIVTGGRDPAQTTKILSKFSKQYGSLKVKGGYLDGGVIDAAKLSYLATLPSRDDLIAKVVYAIKSPSVKRFARTRPAAVAGAP